MKYVAVILRNVDSIYAIRKNKKTYQYGLPSAMALKDNEEVVPQEVDKSFMDKYSVSVKFAKTLKVVKWGENSIEYVVCTFLNATKKARSNLSMKGEWVSIGEIGTKNWPYRTKLMLREYVSETLKWRTAISTTIGEFSSKYTAESFKNTCHNFVKNICGLPVMESNDRSWVNCFNFLADNLPKDERFKKFHLIFEFVVPDSSKRPDVILLTSHKVLILEFKDKHEIQQDDVLQVLGYKHSLLNCHEKTQDWNMKVVDSLVYTLEFKGTNHLTTILKSSSFKNFIINELNREQPLSDFECDDWVRAPYQPLPMMTDNVKELFTTGELPNIKTIKEGDIQEALDKIDEIISNKQAHKKIIFLSGVPGSGKTLVGLTVVCRHIGTTTYEGKRIEPVYISGNGPLVNILQGSLSTDKDKKEGKSIIRGIDNYLKSSRDDTSAPLNNIIVFDEAQRAWDKTAQNNKDSTEPALLLQQGNKIEQKYNDCTILCLFGDGQFIYKNEEGGLKIWKQALQGHDGWQVYVPKEYKNDFSGVDNVTICPELKLDVSIRNDFIDVSKWVEAILDADLVRAKKEYALLVKQGFRCYLKTEVTELAEIVHTAKEEMENPHVAIVLSSYSKDALPSNDKDLRKFFGNQYKGNYVAANEAFDWYENHCTDLQKGATEFTLQGIELDYSIVSFLGDYYLKNNKWTIGSKVQFDKKIINRAEIIENVYRVLLTRSRKATYIYIPESLKNLDETRRWFKEMMEL